MRVQKFEIIFIFSPLAIFVTDTDFWKWSLGNLFIKVVALGTFKYCLNHTHLLVFFEFRLLPIYLSILYLSFIRPSKRSIFNVNDPEGVKNLTRLHLRFSHLNEHKFRRGFLDTLDPLCSCSLEVEDNEHFFHRCLSFENAWRSLFIDISSTNSSFKNLPSHLKVELLLFGNSNLPSF